MLAVSGALRCISFISPKSEWSIYVVGIAQALIALCGPVVITGPPKISERWFSLEERTLATGVASTATYVGVAVGFLIPSYLVQLYGFRNYLLIEAGFTTLIYLLVLCYFPEYPPTPPSHSAKLEKELAETFTLEEFLTSMKEIITNPSFLIVSLAGVWQIGIFAAWQGLFNYIFNDLLDETFVGWLVVH